MSERGGSARRSSSIVAQQVTSVFEREHELAVIDENATNDEKTLGALGYKQVSTPETSDLFNQKPLVERSEGMPYSIDVDALAYFSPSLSPPFLIFPIQVFRC